MLRAPSSPILQPWVAAYWFSGPTASAAGDEWVLPDGHAHLALRLDGHSVRVAHGDDEPLDTIGDLVLAGPCLRRYRKQVSGNAGSIGLLLRPGATRALFGIAAHELLDTHVALEDLCGTTAARLRDVLHSNTSPDARLAAIEAVLRTRLRPVHSMHPQVAARLGDVERGERIDQVAEHAGYSARRFGTLFRDAVGMAPKPYAGLRRFIRALHGAASDRDWADVALDAGYSDQAHLIREFRAHAGCTPGAYRRAGARALRHVAVGALSPAR